MLLNGHKKQNISNREKSKIDGKFVVSLFDLLDFDLGVSHMNTRLKQIVILFCGFLFTLPVYSQADLNWAGDLVSTRAFMKDIAAIYAGKEHVQIEMKVGQTAQSIGLAASGKVDIAGSGRSALPNSLAEHRVRFYPIAWDALVVILHPDNPIHNMSVVQLRDILKGRIKNWSALGFEDAPIHLYIHNDNNDSVAYNTRELLLGSSDAQVDGFKLLSKREEIEKSVEKDVYGIAITMYSGARKLKVSMPAIEGVPPRTGTIVSGDYLLYQPLYIVAKENGKNRRKVRKLLRFIQGRDGTRVMRRNGIAPYTENLTLVSKQLDREQFLLNALSQ